MSEYRVISSVRLCVCFPPVVGLSPWAGNPNTVPSVNQLPSFRPNSHKQRILCRGIIQPTSRFVSEEVPSLKVSVGIVYIRWQDLRYKELKPVELFSIWPPIVSCAPYLCKVLRLLFLHPG